MKLCPLCNIDMRIIDVRSPAEGVTEYESVCPVCGKKDIEVRKEKNKNE